MSGVSISGINATGNRVAGNFIGTDVTGTLDVGNTLDGVVIAIMAANNIIGGDDDDDGSLDGLVGARNIISGNDSDGVEIRNAGATGNRIEGNFIGTDVTGTADLGNTQNGVFIVDAPNNTIGGTTAGARNIISGNGCAGVEIFNAGASGNHVEGNFIGTDVTGTTDLGNSQNGVIISLAPNNTIGGNFSAGGNVIAFNKFAGVDVSSSATSNVIRRNSIFSNVGLGIDLGGDGVTPNDPGDGDPGPNNLQNFPVLGSAVSDAAGTTIQGGLNSTANSLSLIDFYSNVAPDPSGLGEGKTYVGSTVVSTDASGNAVYSATFPVTGLSGQFLTATATTASASPYGATSEFSQAIDVTVPPSPPAPNVFTIDDVTAAEGDAGTTAFLFTVSRSGDTSGSATVDFATADGTGAAPSDYQSNAGTVSFGPGQANRIVAVLVNGDTTFEPGETFFVNLSNPSTGTIGDPQGQGLILNDDTAPRTLSVNDVSTVEGNSGTHGVTFTVTLSSASASNVTVQFSTAQDSATKDVDYVHKTGTLTFTPGQTSKMVTVQVKGDTTAEANERFKLNLFNPTGGATISDGTGFATIVNDDGAVAVKPKISVGGVSLLEGNSGTKAFQFKVVLDKASTSPVTVKYGTSNGTASAGSDYTALSLSTLTFAANETVKWVTVFVKGDLTSEANETFFLNLSSPTNATIAVGKGTGTIRNDD
jgi:hypothetical protein